MSEEKKASENTAFKDQDPKNQLIAFGLLLVIGGGLAFAGRSGEGGDITGRPGSEPSKELKLDGGWKPGGDAAFYKERAIGYIRKGEADKAIEDLSQAIKLKDNDPFTFGLRGKGYLNQGKDDLAIKDFSKVVSLSPRDPFAYFGRGMAYLGAGEIDKAIEDLSHGLILKPDEADAYIGRGMAYKRKGNEAKAKADFLKAKELKAKAKNKP